VLRGQAGYEGISGEIYQTKPGDVKLVETGETISRHDGVYFYTIGQRHGLTLASAGGRILVVKKDLKKFYLCTIIQLKKN